MGNQKINRYIRYFSEKIQHYFMSNYQHYIYQSLPCIVHLKKKHVKSASLPLPFDRYLSGKLSKSVQPLIKGSYPTSYIQNLILRKTIHSRQHRMCSLAIPATIYPTNNQIYQFLFPIGKNCHPVFKIQVVTKGISRISQNRIYIGNETQS